MHMLNALLWLCIGLQVVTGWYQHAELSWEKSCICRVMHGNELHNQTTIHVVNDGVYWLNVLRKISNVFLFFFQMCLRTWKNDLRTWKYKLLGIYTQDYHPHKQTAKFPPKTKPPLLCINSTVESFNEEFFRQIKTRWSFCWLRKRF